MQAYTIYLNLFVVFNLLLIILIVLQTKEKSNAQFFLAWVFVICIISIANNLGFWYFQNRYALFVQLLGMGVNFTWGLCILCYVRVLNGNKIVKNLFWHFTPCIVIFLYGFSILFDTDKEIAVAIKSVIAGDHVVISLINIFMVLHIMSYLIVAKRQISKIKQETKDTSTISDKIRLKWSSNFVFYMAVNSAILLIAYIVSLAVFSQSFYFCDMVVFPIINFSAYCFIVYKNAEMLNAYKNLAVQEQTKVVVDKTIVNKQDWSDMRNRLESHMQTTKTFTNIELNLHKLAEELLITPNQLSQFINQSYEISFTELINKFRVDEAKLLLLDKNYEHLKVEAIGELSGFSSRSSFFSVFKKHTGLTPSSFKTL